MPLNLAPAELKNFKLLPQNALTNKTGLLFFLNPFLTLGYLKLPLFTGLCRGHSMS